MSSATTATNSECASLFTFGDSHRGLHAPIKKHAGRHDHNKRLKTLRKKCDATGAWDHLVLLCAQELATSSSHTEVLRGGTEKSRLVTLLCKAGKCCVPVGSGRSSMEGWAQRAITPLVRDRRSWSGPFVEWRPVSAGSLPGVPGDDGGDRLGLLAVAFGDDAVEDRRRQHGEEDQLAWLVPGKVEEGQRHQSSRLRRRQGAARAPSGPVWRPSSAPPAK